MVIVIIYNNVLLHYWHTIEGTGLMKANLIFNFQDIPKAIPILQARTA